MSKTYTKRDARDWQRALAEKDMEIARFVHEREAMAELLRQKDEVIQALVEAAKPLRVAGFMRRVAEYLTYLQARNPENFALDEFTSYAEGIEDVATDAEALAAALSKAGRKP